MSKHVAPARPTTRHSSGALPSWRRATFLLAYLIAALGHSADANIPRPPHGARHASTLLDPGVFDQRREPSSRHEPSMLDKLEGANLRSTQEEAPVAGVVVVAVHHTSAMWRNGLRPADVIVAVVRDRVRSLDDLESALGKVAWGFVLEVVREGERKWILVP